MPTQPLSEWEVRLHKRHGRPDQGCAKQGFHRRKRPFVDEGRGTELPVQNATAFIPGQHREYASNRNGRDSGSLQTEVGKRLSTLLQ